MSPEPHDGHLRVIAANRDGLVQPKVGHVELSRGVSKHKPHAANRYHSILALVLCLLVWSGPAAVAWFVVAVEVDPVQRATARAWPHISEKCGKVMQPFGAHPDAPAAIVRVLHGGASSLSSSPCPVFLWDRRSFELTPNSGSVRQVLGRAHLTPKTSATRNATAHKFCAWSGRLSSAIAPANPRRQAATVFRAEAEHDESSETPPCFVVQWHARIIQPSVSLSRKTWAQENPGA